MASFRKKLRRLRWRADPLCGLDTAEWVTQCRAAAPRAVALIEPAWRGIASSMASLFSTRLEVKDAVTPRTARRIADLLVQAGVERVAIGGFPLTYVHLVDQLACLRVKVYPIWHGSFVQCNEQYGWRSFQTVKQLAAERRVAKLGFVKAGMAEVFKGLGIPAAFVLSTAGAAPQAASQPNEGGPHLGLWAVRLTVWRKLPFAMLVAAGDIPGAIVYISGADQRIQEFTREFGIRAEIRDSAIPQDQLPAALRRMHLNLYVTFSECCPMLPLESLTEGVPCLLGPTSHLFEDDAYLHDRLVVPYPDRNDVIASSIRQALAERSEIIAAYRAWLPNYQRRSETSVAELLDLPAESCGRTDRADAA